MVDPDEILTQWSYASAMIRKPGLREGCDVIEQLCVEIKRLEKEVAYQKRRQDTEEQKYRGMLLEVQNVVTRYFRDYEEAKADE